MKILGSFMGLVIGVSACGQSPAWTVNDLFNGEELQELRLEMEAADWQSLKDNYLEDTYYRCRFLWKDQVVAGAGVRSRGSNSRNGVKPGLGVDFSKFASGQRFLGLKSVVLRNAVQDASMVHERLAMGLFEKMGLKHEKTASAKVFVNGEYVGLYTMVEPVDTRYLKDRFGESNGYLFEFNWQGDGYQWEYLGDDPGLYVPERFEPKNHEDAPDAEWVASMVRAVNTGVEEGFEAEAEKYLDMDVLLKHVAVETYLAEWDGFLGDTGTTNFYLYRRGTDHKGELIAWDKEGTFAGVEWWIFHNTDVNAVTARALAVKRYYLAYLEAVAAVSGEAGGGDGWLAQEAERLIGQVREAALEDPFPMCDEEVEGVGCKAARREEAWEKVRRFAAERQWMVEAMLGEAWRLEHEE